MSKVKIGIVNNLGLAHIQSITNITRISTMHKDTIITYCSQGSVSAMRNEIVDNFLKGNGTHLLFLDSDMVFPDNTIKLLLKANHDVIGGVYNTKSILPMAVFYNKLEDGYESVSNFTHPIQEVDATGCGCLMIKRRVLEKMQAPFFLETIRNTSRVGEDIYFCEKVKELGYKIYVNFNVGCGHIATIVIPPPTLEKI